MNRLEEIMTYNQAFIAAEGYAQFQTNKEPAKKMLILSCMDTRLTELLPQAMNIKNGDAKLVKNAGATVMHPFGSIIRSIVVAIYEFAIEDIFVVGHYGCGMSNLNSEVVVGKMVERGIDKEVVNTLTNAGIDIRKWLHGFESVESAILESVSIIEAHPLVPKDVRVHGLIMSPDTGALTIVHDGN
ncbi:carbonic anhydrase [Fusibacter paucivorans]|uniref:carbonic anhydrase n=1 Tax=Fusibacter paucivorans TaxID=76009 RepID=A0ABS5PNR8_9FIRM|nr:carbonic anhydrase [Fusibacter paucivorans]MBS7525981.1 carbonic anhydrase [Fusibacter paucivorans]